MALSGKRILLVVSGGIAAFKVLELVRRLRERDVTVRAILTKAGVADESDALAAAERML